MRPRAAGFAVAVSAAALVASGCSDSVSGTAAPEIDREDPLAVIETALETMFTWDPTRDASGADALERARPYLGPELASSTASESQPGPGSQWEQWKHDEATIRAEALFLADEHPPDNDHTVHRVVTIRQSATTPHNLVLDENQHTAWVVATKGPDGWRLDSMHF